MNSFRVFAALCGTSLFASGLRADVQVSPLFSDNMVLQRNLATPVWGTGDVGEAVTVSINGQSHKTITEADGKWMVKLAPLQAAESLDMTVSGKNTLSFKNVAVGEVWLASGQSNMEYEVWGALNRDAEIANSADPSLRMFTVKKNAAPEMQTTLSGKWEQAGSPQTGHFSAVAYFFARELRKKLNVRIGVIHISWGGTPVKYGEAADVALKQ